MFGILNIYKPSGPTSRDCINTIQRLIRPTKVGHAGTLDPIADGVLVVPVGQAVRLVDPIHELPKSYLGKFRFGVTSPSGDTETQVTPIANAPVITQEQLAAAIPSFLGTIEQRPSAFSAIRIEGRRAHELARQGVAVEMPVRQVEIFQLELVAFDYPNFELKVHCSTGTYMRTLGQDIARSLGTDAVMTSLTRTSVGPFRLEQAVALEDLIDATMIESQLLPASLGIAHWSICSADPNLVERIHQGKTVLHDELISRTNTDSPDSLTQIAVVDLAGTLVSLLFRLPSGEWRADKNFNVEATAEAMRRYREI